MNNELKGLVLVGIAGMLFSWMSVFIKLSTLPAFQIFFSRSLAQVLIVLTVSAFNERNPWGSKNARAVLITSGTFGGMSVALLFYCVRHGQLGDVTSIFYTAPALTSLVSSIIYKDRFKGSNMISIIFAVFGSILIVKPPIFFGKGASNDSFTTLLLSAVGAMTTAIFYLTLPLVNQKSSLSCSIFYFSLCGLFLSIVPMAVTHPRLIKGLDWLWMILIVFTGYFGQLALNEGLKIASRETVLLRNMDIAYAFLFSYMIFHDQINTSSVCGAILICTGSIIMIIGDIKGNHRGNVAEEEPLIAANITENK